MSRTCSGGAGQPSPAATTKEVAYPPDASTDPRPVTGTGGEAIVYATPSAPVLAKGKLTPSQRAIAECHAAYSRGPVHLIRYANALQAQQEAAAEREWDQYQLWFHSHTGEFLGVVNPEGTYRRVQRSLIDPRIAVCASPWQSVLDATNSALRRMAAEKERQGKLREARELRAAQVQCKQVLIARLLVRAGRVERGGAAHGREVAA